MKIYLNGHENISEILLAIGKICFSQIEQDNDYFRIEQKKTDGNK